jgi:hypothetical protein
MERLNLAMKHMLVAMHRIKTGVRMPPSGQGVINLVHPSGASTRAPHPVIDGAFNRMVCFLAKNVQLMTLCEFGRDGDGITFGTTSGTRKIAGQKRDSHQGERPQIKTTS